MKPKTDPHTALHAPAAPELLSATAHRWRRAAAWALLGLLLAAGVAAAWLLR